MCGRVDVPQEFLPDSNGNLLRAAAVLPTGLRTTLADLGHYYKCPGNRVVRRVVWGMGACFCALCVPPQVSSCRLLVVCCGMTLFGAVQHQLCCLVGHFVHGLMLTDDALEDWKKVSQEFAATHGGLKPSVCTLAKLIKKELIERLGGQSESSATDGDGRCAVRDASRKRRHSGDVQPAHPAKKCHGNEPLRSPLLCSPRCLPG